MSKQQYVCFFFFLFSCHQELATAEGNILDNHTLLDSLNQTKANSLVIQEALAESSRIQVSLDKVGLSKAVYVTICMMLMYTLNHIFFLFACIL